MGKYIYIAILINILPLAVHGQIEDEIDEFVETVLGCTDVPGLSLTVINDGQELMAKGYGIEDVETQAPVTEESLFLIASVTKAFAGVAAATVLKNAEGVTWYTPIRDVLGEDFYLNDALRTQRTNLNDLFAHRMGIPGHNPIRIAGYTLDELVSKLRFLEFTTDFRTNLYYNNIMYGLAEHVLEMLDGRTWKDIIRGNIYEPLGMNSSSFITEVDDWSRVVTAYYNDDDGSLREVSKEVPLAYYGSQGSSGSLCISSQDMVQWMLFQLNQGTAPDGTEVLTPVEFWGTHERLIQTRGGAAYSRPDYPATYNPPASYSSGWYESTYRDYFMWQHGGSMAGYTSHMSLLPDMDTGVYVAVNKSPDYGAKNFIVMYILDLLLGEEPWLSSDNVCDMINGYKQEHGEQMYSYATAEEEVVSRTPHRQISKASGVRQIEQYVGVYGNYAYGNVTIEIDDATGALVLLYGEDNFTWDLTEDAQDQEFTGQGREPFWYWSMAVNFDSDGIQASSVTVWFEATDPPRFERNLDFNNPPPPPELCPELNP